jgi:hypothetical protein
MSNIIAILHRHRILDETDILEIERKYSFVPVKTTGGKWKWLSIYYKVVRPADVLIFTEEEYLIEKLKGLDVTF